MKKILKFATAALLSTSLFLSCGKDTKNVIKVGATPEPHAEMLNLIKEDVEAAGYTLEVVEFTDYVTPNEALESGDIDANFFQHLPYMNSFNSERGYHLVSAAGIHIEPIALYSKKVTKLADLKNGAEIAIPNDPTNEGRALLLLEAAGLIKLEPDAGLEATPVKVAENPKGLKFVEVEAATLPRVLEDVEAAVINGNYAIPVGLSATKDGLFIENAESPYVNIVTVKDGNQNDPKVQAVVKALQSDKVKNWVADKYKNGEVVVVF